MGCRCQVDIRFVPSPSSSLLLLSPKPSSLSFSLFFRLHIQQSSHFQVELLTSSKPDFLFHNPFPRNERTLPLLPKTFSFTSNMKLSFYFSFSILAVSLGLVAATVPSDSPPQHHIVARGPLRHHARLLEARNQDGTMKKMYKRKR